MALARKYGVLARFGLFAADVALAFAAAVFASYMTLPSDGATSFWQHFHWHLTFYQTFVVVWCGAASANRLYSSQRGDSLPA